MLDFHSAISEGLLSWIRNNGGWSVLWRSNSWNLDRVDFWGKPAIATSPILVPFWFMRDLIVCISISPLLFVLFKDNRHKYIKILAVAILSLLYFTQTSLVIPGFSSLAFFYFGIGAFLSLSNRSLVGWAQYLFREYIVSLLCGGRRNHSN